MDIQYWLSVAAFVAIVVVLVVKWWLNERKEIAHRKKAAGKNNWTYSYLSPMMFLRYRNLRFIEHDATSRRVKHLLKGDHRGRVMTMFTYRYSLRRKEFSLRGARHGQAWSRKTKHRERGVVTLQLPVKTPEIEVAPRGPLSKWAQEKGLSMGDMPGARAAALFGASVSVDTGDPDFDKEFLVTTSDIEFALGMLTDDLRQWMLESGAERAVVITGDEIITWGSKTGIRAGKEKADYLIDVLDHMPSSVLPEPQA